MNFHLPLPTAAKARRRALLALVAAGLALGLAVFAAHGQDKSAIFLPQVERGGEPLTSALIGPEGGKLEYRDGDTTLLRLDVPPGALREPVRISIDHGDERKHPTHDSLAVGPPFALHPHGLHFAKPVRVTVTYDSRRMPDGATREHLVLLHHDHLSATTEVITPVDADTTTLKADLHHFSTVQPHALLPDQGDPRNDATDFTKTINKAYLELLDFSDQQDFADASQGKVADLPAEPVKKADGSMVWDPAKFAFIQPGSSAPDTVNPSLWRQSQLTTVSGLFKVTDRLYQVRNYDLSNMTILEGDTGLIVIDPLVSAEVAAAALKLYYQNRPRLPVVAVIYSHSHVDHYGGVKGLVSEDDVNSGKVHIYAPAGFMDHAIKENVYAGNAMTRRASYMYGGILPADPKGLVGTGLGTTTSLGTVTLIAPTDPITGDNRVTIDGLDFEFMLAPDTEAPSEMFWYLPQLGALSLAEDCVHTLHNTYSLRGTKARDPLAWSKYIDQALRRWGGGVQVLYGMHHWPVWTNARVVGFMARQRDLYRFINDQTLRLANEGYTPIEIAERLTLPVGQIRHWASRGYYGSVSHDVKAVYDLYLGWFDGNPANLHPLPPEEAGQKYVAFMGGADNLLTQARAAYGRGEYRWVAQVVNHLVFADPTNQAAKDLQAAALEQMGYQAESGPWRNFYLAGAQELRQGVNSDRPSPSTASPDTIDAMDLSAFFDYMGIKLNGVKATGQNMVINWSFTDTNEQYVLRLENSALNNRAGETDPNPTAAVTLTRATLNELLLGELGVVDAITQGKLQVTGDKVKLGELFLMFDKFEFWFNIVTP